MPGPRVVFFDLGETLVEPRSSPTGLTRFDPYPFVPEALAKMKAAPIGARLGAISDTPPGTTAAKMKSLLTAAGIFDLFDPALLLYSSVEGLDKSSQKIFLRAASFAGVPPGRCIFCGEDAEERRFAKQAGMKPSFHPLHAFHVLKQLD